MSILTASLPDTAEICGKNYAIETDFRWWIEFSQLIFSENQDAATFIKMIMLVFKKESGCPPSKIETVKAMLGFFNPFSSDSGRGDSSQSRSKIYDFDYDAKVIYSSFMQQYNINLTKCSLHWWEFKSLFDGLSEDTPFGKVMQYRCVDLNDISDKKMKKHYTKMKKLYALPDNRTEKEKEQALADSFGFLM